MDDDDPIIAPPGGPSYRLYLGAAAGLLVLVGLWHLINRPAPPLDIHAFDGRYEGPAKARGGCADSTAVMTVLNGQASMEWGRFVTFTGAPDADGHLVLTMSEKSKDATLIGIMNRDRFMLRGGDGRCFWQIAFHRTD